MGEWLTGTGSLKNLTDIGKFLLEKIAVGKFPFELESSERSWAYLSEFPMVTTVQLQRERSNFILDFPT